MVKSSGRLKSTIFHLRARKALTSVVSETVIQEDLYTASHSYHVHIGLIPHRKMLQVLKKYIPVAYFIPRHSPKAHMKASNMVDMYGVHAIRFQARARAPDLV